PRPAVLAVTLPGTSGTAPIVPASAEEPPPPRAAGFVGAAKAPAVTTCAIVIAVFGRDSEASFSHAAAGCGALCAMAVPGRSNAVRINMERIGDITYTSPYASRHLSRVRRRRPDDRGSRANRTGEPR